MEGILRIDYPRVKDFLSEDETEEPAPRNYRAGLCQLRSAASAEAQPERDTGKEFVEIGSGDLAERDDEIVRQQVVAFTLAIAIRKNGAIRRLCKCLSNLGMAQPGIFTCFFDARDERLPILGRGARASATARHAGHYKLD